MKLATTLTVTALVFLVGCPQPEVAHEVPEKPTVIEAQRTALGVIREARASIEADCGTRLKDIDTKGLSELKIHPTERDEADRLLADLGLMAGQCGSYDKIEAVEGCSQDCSWCPVKWYWCIENAGACAGGDNKACCKLGACGSKHHCEDTCKSSCSCNVPPLPADGGGDEGL